MTYEQSVYWFNCGWDDYSERGLEVPEHGRYSTEEMVFVQHGFEHARLGFHRMLERCDIDPISTERSNEPS